MQDEQGASCRAAVLEGGIDGRSIRFFDTASNGLVFTLAAERGELFISLTQQGDGQVKIVHLQDGKVRKFEAKSFAELFSSHRKYLNTEFFPLLKHNGIGLPLTPYNPKIIQVVLSMLRSESDPKIRAEGENLVADLGSDLFRDREAATKILTEKYALYSKFIHAADADEDASQEVKVRLEKIISENKNHAHLRDVATSMKLTNDVEYLKGLLEDLNEDDRKIVSAALKKLGDKKQRRLRRVKR